MSMAHGTDDYRERNLSLDEWISAGASVAGCRIAKISLLLRDGRRVRVDLPESAPNQDERPLTPSQQQILGILKASRAPMTRRQIAEAMGREGISGKFSGYIRDLVSRKRATEIDGEISDDIAKFGDLSE